MLRDSIEEGGFRPMLLDYMQGYHVPDEICDLVFDEDHTVARVIRLRAQMLQEEVAERLGGTVVEEEEFMKRICR